MPPIRINKYLAENGYCSRREADRLIEAGRVFINDEEARLGDKITDRDVVRVDGRDRHKKIEYVYILLNKPAGNHGTELVNVPERIFSVKHLELENEGLLLLTNDQILSKRITHPDHDDEEEFVVTIDTPLESKDIKQWQVGIELGNKKTDPAEVRKIDAHRFAIILHNRQEQQIRRMCSALGYQVTSLKRTRLLTLKMPSTYPTGNWRHLTEKEVEELKTASRR